MQVEKLIKELPSMPADWSNGDADLAEKNSTSNGISTQHVENGTNLRETQSMLLERIASEMNRLKFYMAHAQVLYCSPSHIVFSFCHIYTCLAFYLGFFQLPISLTRIRSCMINLS